MTPGKSQLSHCFAGWLLRFCLLALWLPGGVATAEADSRADVPVLVDPAAFAQSLTDTEQAWLLAHPVVRVGVNPDFPPYTFREDDGQYQGLGVDYLQLLGSMLNIEFRVVSELGWAQGLAGRDTGEIDVVATTVKTSNNKQWYEFTKPITQLTVVIVARNDNITLRTSQDLRGKTVALVKHAATTERLVNEFPGIKGVFVETPLAALEAVAAGTADACVESQEASSHLIKRHHLKNLKFVSIYSTDVASQSFAVRKDWFPLAGIIDKALAAIPARSHAILHEKWLDMSAPPRIARPAILEFRLTPAERTWLDTHPTVRIGYNPDNPPIEFIDENGNYAGIGADYLGLLEQRLGIKLQIVPNIATWSQAIAMAGARQVDALPLVIPGPALSQSLTLTHPYVKETTIIVTRKDYPFISGLANLSGKRVAAVQEAALEEIRRRYPRLAVVPADSTLDGLEAVHNGVVDALINGSLASAYYIRKHNLANLKFAAPAEFQAPGFSFGVRSDWPMMAAVLDKALDTISEEEHLSILNKWLSLQYETKFDYTLLWQVMLGASILLAIFFYWNRRLAHEIDQRKQAEIQLQSANQVAEAANLAKSAFLASMSHELRTPLNSIIGFNCILMNEMAGPLNFEQKKQLKMVRGSAQHLLDLINDVLDISKIEAGELELSWESFNMRNVVEQVKETLAPLAEKKGLDLTVAIAPEVGEIYCDQRRIRQVLINLTNNAIKFTESGEVKIDCRVSGDRLEIQVIDTGIGIKKEDLDKLFKPFQQLDTGTARQYEGTGLGLSVSKRIVDLAGGEIGVESRFGEGSDFWFTLPLKQGGPHGDGQNTGD